MCFGRVFCFEAESIPVKGIGPREIEEITGQDSCCLNGLFELPVGNAGGLRQGSEVGVGAFYCAVAFGFHKRLGPVFEVRVGLGGQSQVIESDPELLS